LKIEAFSCDETARPRLHNRAWWLNLRAPRYRCQYTGAKHMPFPAWLIHAAVVCSIVAIASLIVFRVL
jgi:hypothetical protein